MTTGKYHGHKTETRDAEWLRSVWDWAREIERDHGVIVQVSMYPELRLGVWKVVVRALGLVDGKPKWTVGQLKGEYPNASAQGLSAYLFALLNGLDRHLAEDGLRQPEI